MQKMGQQQGHKPVLEEGAVLNDAPLRSRMLHVAADHSIYLVHAGAVKTCSVAVEMYLRDILQQMIRVHSIRTKQAKDVPGMMRDTSRNWARDVRFNAHPVLYITAYPDIRRVITSTHCVACTSHRMFVGAGGYHC